MSYYTAINCMDGRVQRPALDYLTERFGADYIDTITESGANGVLARREDPALVESILRKVTLSIEKHRTIGIAVAGHYDCAGNPGDKNHQNRDTAAAARFLREQFPDTPIIGLWIDDQWTCEEIEV